VKEEKEILATKVTKVRKDVLNEQIFTSSTSTSPSLHIFTFPSLFPLNVQLLISKIEFPSISIQHWDGEEEEMESKEQSEISECNDEEVSARER
jgi:hypothetical protein